MRSPYTHLIPVLATTQLDGESAFMEFIHSAGRAFTHNQAVAPLVGLVILGVLIVLADWKFAGWIERWWRRRRHAGDRATPRTEHRAERPAHR